jgi:hypothetical protein
MRMEDRIIIIHDIECLDPVCIFVPSESDCPALSYVEVMSKDMPCLFGQSCKGFNFPSDIANLSIGFMIYRLTTYREFHRIFYNMSILQNNTNILR